MSTELTVVQPTNNAAIYKQSTDAADLCKGIVVATAMEIQNRRYVKVEGWQAIAIAHGCTISSRDVERVDGGVRAIGEVRRMSDGAVIAEAEGFVGEDEPTWYGGEVTTKWGKKMLPRRNDYAIRAMAQTRAISRAGRSAFAHVVVMMNAGLSTTPAEEVPDGGFHDAHYEEAPKDNRPAQRATPADPRPREAAPPAKAADPGNRTLAQRADMVVNVLEQCVTTDQMRKHYTNASKVLADLDAVDPDRLEAINKLYARRFKELAAAEIDAERGAA